MSLNGIRSFLYAICRLLGDAQAMRKGPNAIARRLVRKAAGRQMGKLLRKI
jgi:hypothetical protein